MTDPRADVDRLAAQTAPYVIGVRHHSPALARVMPALLDAAAPDTVAVELPPEAADWVTWLDHPDAVAPIALALAPAAGHGADDGGVCFYPFADFSPELAALRWAREHAVAVRCIDLSVSSAVDGEVVVTDHAAAVTYSSVADEISGAHDSWDRLVEARAPGADPRAIRRAGLAHGLGVRASDPPTVADPRTLLRECAMRDGIRRSAGRVVAVVGAFHAPALRDSLIRDDGLAREDSRVLAAVARPDEVVASLVPYSGAQLDDRSGYPAGIADPGWQREMLVTGHDPALVRAAATTALTAIAREIRKAGHPCGTGEVAEAARMTVDLSALRGLPAPGRAELLEALTSVFAQGDVWGRGRVVARAAEMVLVSDDRGAVAPGTPRSALGADLVATLRELRLLGKADSEIRLDPLRSPLDARREIFFERCAAGGFPAATPMSSRGVGGADAVTSRWRMADPATVEARAAAAAAFGTTVSQVAGVLISRRALASADGAHGAFAQAVRCGFPDVARETLVAARAALPGTAIGHIVEVLNACEVFTAAASPGARVAGMDALSDAVADVRADAAGALVAVLPGLAGSTSADDARLLGEVARIVGAHRVRLASAMNDLVSDAPPFMSGAALGALEILQPGGHLEQIVAQARLRVDGAVDAGRRNLLRQWLSGFLCAAGSLLVDGDDLRTAVAGTVEDLPDDAFVARLPALRGGFEVLDDEHCDSLLRALGVRGTWTVDPATVGRWAADDAAARERVTAAGLAQIASYSPAVRWKLVLGRHQGSLRPGSAAAWLGASLDRAYGGRRSPGRGPDGAGAGSGPPDPGFRDWNDVDLAELFGSDTRDEVLAAAAGRGDTAAALALDPASVRPSVELLQSILALSGGMSPDGLAKLRPLVRRCVDDLTRQLATDLQPALRGLGTPRRTYRPTRLFDARATIGANLSKTIIIDEGDRSDGGANRRRRIVPERPVFRERALRHVGWHVIVLVDVSGSMEPSTVFAALTAAILSGVPSLSVSFLTFSTQVADLTDHVDDPLALLVEVSVGGGTDIGLGLAAAAERVRVPRRTMLALISDFDDGGSTGALLASVRALADSGVAMLGCAALDDTGAGRYDVGTAARVAAAGMPVAAVTPAGLARWVGEIIGGRR